VCGKQQFGCLPGRDILHRRSPFSADLNVPEAGVKQARERGSIPRGSHGLSGNPAKCPQVGSANGSRERAPDDKFSVIRRVGFALPRENC
jgi:hypothetical protein